MHKGKVLFVASVAVHIHAFHRPYLKWLSENGYEVHTACNGDFADPYVSHHWNIGFERSPWSFSHISTLFTLINIINKNNYTLLSCHTPMASVLTRLASIFSKRRHARTIYTSHGFHFFKGSGAFSWMFYYPIEILLTYISSAVICINQEDLKNISKRGSKNTKYYLIPGIGVSSLKFYPITETEKTEARPRFGFNETDFILLYAAEFIHRKNHKMLIDAVARLAPKMSNLKVVLAGEGELLHSTQKYVDNYGLSELFVFPGFLNNISDYYKISDLVVSSSRQEGLGINIVEAMMCGIPVIATDDRGHRTVIDDGINGYLVPQDDSYELSRKIDYLHTHSEVRSHMSSMAICKASKFELSRSVEAMSKIYGEMSA